MNGKWKVERAGTAKRANVPSSGYGYGWYAFSQDTEVGYWRSTWVEAFSLALDEAKEQLMIGAFK